MRLAALAFLVSSLAWPKTEVVALPGKSPLVNFRIVFRVGAASDPAGKHGAAALTAAMLSRGGTKSMTYKQVVDALFPMAASIQEQVDKEMTVFSGVTHIDNLENYYRIFREALLEPGWREEDLKRLRDDLINYLQITLRGNNDEELGKEVLYNEIYRGRPYGWNNAGAVADLQAITMEDLKKFYREHFTQANLILGVAGGYPPGFLDRVKKDFAALPAGVEKPLKLPSPAPISATRVVMVEKKTRSVAYSLGFPIEVRRGHPDYPALLVAQSYLGQHRQSTGRLYQRMREARGLNYGDYAYIEYFPRGMFQFEPDPNLARQQQIFQIWIRPVEPPTAHFALRLAMFELNRFLRDGISEEAFQKTRNFVSKYVNLLLKTKDAELGYAIDSRWYGIPDYPAYIRQALAKMTREDVNRAIRKHLRSDRMVVVVVAQDCDALKRQFLSEAPSPMTYNAPKPEEITREDKIIETLKLGFQPENIQIVPVEKIFE